MLTGPQRVFFVVPITNEIVPSHSSKQVPQSFWQQSSLTSLQPSKLSIFFIHRKAIKAALNKLQVALCLFSFGIFSFLKSLFLVCPLIFFISNLIKIILNRIGK
jgi:hypothetical protein